MKNLNFAITHDIVATRWQRFLNGLLDLLIIHTILATIATTVVLIADITNNYDMSSWAKSTTVLERLFVWVVVVFLYYFWTEAYYGRTFAKYFTETIVVTKQGLKPSYKAILLRTLCRFIPLEAITFMGTNIRGLHDFLSDTYVVRKHEFNHKKGVVAFP